MGLSRDEVFIANVLKCRPPENRTPTLEEMDHCIGYLAQQIEIIRPEFICLLGKVAMQGLLKTDSPMGRARGKWYYYKGIPTVATYHPSYLLLMQTRRQMRSVGRSSNAHERNGAQAAGTETSAGGMIGFI